MLKWKTLENLEFTENEGQLNNNFTDKAHCMLLLSLTVFSF